jgi:hypothetical protein
MKKIAFFIATALLFLTTATAQSPNNNDEEVAKRKPLGFGLKAGYNYNNVTNAAAINAKSAAGFQVGAFLAPGGFQQKPSVLGYRSEIIFSKQGYDFATQKTTGTVSLNYLILPQLTTINITRFVQLQVGGQMAFLLNAKADSTQTGAEQSSPYATVSSFYNKIDYGFAGGIEIHPVKGLLIGARYNISLAKMNKAEEGAQLPALPTPAFIPKGADLKNNMLQVFVGYCF